MIRRDFLKSAGIAGAAALTEGAGGSQNARPTPGRKFDLHTHYYPEAFFQKIRETTSDFSFDKDPTGRTIIKYRGARFFGITPPMTDVNKPIEDMERVGIDVEVCRYRRRTSSSPTPSASRKSPGWSMTPTPSWSPNIRNGSKASLRFRWMRRTPRSKSCAARLTS